ncbi:MAG: hypothetical protein COB93_05760 [Sneathiella sp.]|nr:MAG: hypothetical protein COB93_05760 [Sneathiella sp.]
MVFGNLFKRDPKGQIAGDIYAAIVSQSRKPAFYQLAAVPDTVDGRFEMISLHAFLVMRQLKGEDKQSQKLSQMIFDLMFADMDQSLREMGVGDLGIGKRIKLMAKAFYGRIVAYEAALDGEAESLEAALERNHYGTVENVSLKAVAKLADYVRAADARLKAQGAGGLMTGVPDFGDFS